MSSQMLSSSFSWYWCWWPGKASWDWERREENRRCLLLALGLWPHKECARAVSHNRGTSTVPPSVAWCSPVIVTLCPGKISLALLWRMEILADVPILSPRPQILFLHEDPAPDPGSPCHLPGQGTDVCGYQTFELPHFRANALYHEHLLFGGITQSLSWLLDYFVLLMTQTTRFDVTFWHTQSCTCAFLWVT